MCTTICRCIYCILTVTTAKNKCKKRGFYFLQKSKIFLFFIYFRMKKIINITLKPTNKKHFLHKWCPFYNTV